MPKMFYISALALLAALKFRRGGGMMHVRIAVIGREHGGNDVSDYILIALLTVVGCTYGLRTED